MQVATPGKGTLQSEVVHDPLTKSPKCYRFSRVPYALPPIGPLRWRKPEPLPDDFSFDIVQPSRPCSLCPQPRIFGPQSPDHNEDCLQLNIYVPLEKPPAAGWPVFFYIHGGFLQFGSNNFDNPSALISDTDLKCIFVSPGYRLGIFGFLASKELLHDANFGFWDQRLALEWTYENIQNFGGNKSNIAVGGLSAGSYSTFHQLAYDIGPNSSRQIIRKVFQWSNGCGVQPKRLPEVQQQFDDLISVMNIPSSWSGPQKIESLRQKSADELVAAVGSMKQKFFRPILDGKFMSEGLFSSIFDGDFGMRMHELGIGTVIGDLTQEFHLYKTVYPPNSYESLVDRLSWDYPRKIVIAICAPFKPRNGLPLRSEDEWKNIFGKLYADMQIHSTMRGFVDSIARTLPLSYIHRYRIDWRTESVDKRLPKELGATHGTDMSIWFFGNGDYLTVGEKSLIREWLQPVASFINGDAVAWETSSIKQVRYLTADGKIEVQTDELWEDKLPLWKLTEKITQPGAYLDRSKL